VPALVDVNSLGLLETARPYAPCTGIANGPGFITSANEVSNLLGISKKNRYDSL